MRVRIVCGGAAVLLAAVAALLVLPAHAAPRVPASDGEVLERLPVKPSDPVARELREMRTALAARPDDVDTAVRLARRYFRLAMAEGDPRYVGYGEAALRPWWSAPDAPEAVLVARALLKQYKHDFEAALVDFAAAGQRDPGNEEVWSWRAALHLVQADYEAAAADCAMLKAHASEPAWASCKAWVDGVTGNAREAYAAMSRAMAEDRESGASGRLWTLTRLAELALRMGDAKLAESHFRAALALGLDDQYLLAAYSDFLIDQGRAAEVMPLLTSWTKSDVLLLRLAIAEKALGLPTAGARAGELRDRFAAAAMRQDTLHLQEEARYVLELAGDPRRALSIAVENWRTQREPRDARTLLEAALAAKDREAARPVLDWLQRSRHEDRVIRDLAARVAALQ